MTPGGWPSNSASTITCSTSPRSSTSGWWSPMWPTTRPAGRRTPVSNATGISSSTGCSHGPPTSASTRWRRATMRGWWPGRTANGHCDGGSMATRISRTCCTCSRRRSWPGSGCRSATSPKLRCGPSPPGSGCGPRRSRTARTCASSRAPAAASLSSASRIGLKAARVVDGSGAVVGEVPAVQLVTIGQRKGLGRLDPGSPEPGEHRYVVDVDVPGQTVTVGPAGRLAGHRDRSSGRRLGRRPSGAG